MNMNVDFINTPNPIGNFVNVRITNNYAYISGQGPLLNDGSFAKGVVGENIDLETAQIHAQKCGLAILSALKAEIGDLNKVQQLIKITGFVNCTNDFEKQPLVINGCSDLMKEVFGNKGVHARAAVGVSSLPLGFSVEIEAIFKIQL